MHAFIDESIRPGTYRLTAVLASPTDLAQLARAVRSVVPKGSKRTHLSAESESRRRRIMADYVRLPISAVVYRTAYRQGDNDEPARRRCLEALLNDVTSLKVAVLVLDTRGPDRDAQDRSVISRAVRDGVVPAKLVYAHRGSRDEVLLGLPDAVGWADGAGRHYSMLVEAIVRRADVV